MAFEQERLYKSINQARGIFDSYIYTTIDSNDDILVSGYFGQARYLRAEPERWVGGLLSAFTSDGYRLYLILGDTVRPITDELFRGGYFNYADLATQTTPISILAAAPYSDIPNDGLGPGTSVAFAPRGNQDVWDVPAQLFDFTDYKAGDMIDVRLDLEVTTTKNNQVVETQLLLGVGGTPIPCLWTFAQYKNAGAYPILGYNGIPITDQNIIDNGAKFQIRSDEDLSYKVNGFYIKIIEKG